MLQIQYYNKGLTKTQIEQIIKNYNLKYTTLTNEINLKLNSIIKTVLNDITPFLENIEYLSKQAKQLKEIENTKNHIEILENRLKEKTLIEKELQNNINNLKHEINELKEKEKEYEKNIKIKDDLINEMEKEKEKNKEIISNIQNTNNNKNRKKKRSLDYKYNRNFRNPSYDKIEINKENKTTINEEENNYNNNTNIHMSYKKQKNKNIYKWNDSNKYMMNLKEITRNLNPYHDITLLNKNPRNINKFISNTNLKENKKDNRSKKTIMCSADTRKVKNKEKIRYSNEINSISRFEINKDEDEDEKDIHNSANDIKSINIFDDEIDEEIKQLEIDEQNILNLINKINNFGNDK